MFGYGTVTVEVAGGRDLKLRRIDDPESVRRTITDLIEDTDTDHELPGSPEQWRDVLSVIRDLNTAID
ncbi:MAG: PH domain-containing protein [Halonotius sp.]